MQRLTFWALACGVLVLAAGVSLGWVAGMRLATVEPPNAWMSLDGGFWTDWAVASEDFWDELGVEEERRAELRRIAAARMSEDTELRERLGACARDAREAILAALSDSQRELARELLAKYAEPRFTAEALHELARMRGVVELRPAQEASVYRVVYDSILERHSFFRQMRERWKEDHAARGEWRTTVFDRMREIDGVVAERLGRILSSEQLEKYSEWVESCRKRFGGRHGKGRDGRDGDRRGGRERKSRDDESAPSERQATEGSNEPGTVD